MRNLSSSLASNSALWAARYSATSSVRPSRHAVAVRSNLHLGHCGGRACGTLNSVFRRRCARLRLRTNSKTSINTVSARCRPQQAAGMAGLITPVNSPLLEDCGGLSTPQTPQEREEAYKEAELELERLMASSQESPPPSPGVSPACNSATATPTKGQDRDPNPSPNSDDQRFSRRRNSAGSRRKTTAQVTLTSVSGLGWVMARVVN